MHSIKTNLNKIISASNDTRQANIKIRLSISSPLSEDFLSHLKHSIPNPVNNLHITWFSCFMTGTSHLKEIYHAFLLETSRNYPHFAMLFNTPAHFKDIKAWPHKEGLSKYYLRSEIDAASLISTRQLFKSFLPKHFHNLIDTYHPHINLGQTRTPFIQTKCDIDAVPIHAIEFHKKNLKSDQILYAIYA